MVEYSRRNGGNTSTICSGLVIIAIGLVFLLKNLGVNIPDWIINWPTLLIVIGLLIGFKRGFSGTGWFIMVLVGGFFMLGRIPGMDFSKYYVAVALMVFGLFLIIKPKQRFRHRDKGKRKFADLDMDDLKTDVHEHFEKAKWRKYKSKDDNDVLDALSIFGSSQQHIHSKTFKGGDAIAIFGGCDVNLTQADFEGVLHLDVVAFFGGVKIIVPPSWEVKSDVTAIFGGLEDKRTIGSVGTEPRKIVKISGVAMFGGVEIKNF